MSIEKMVKKKRLCLDTLTMTNPQVCEEIRVKVCDKLEGQVLTGDSIVIVLHAAVYAILLV